ncbi:MAG: hypothetical protein JWL64_1946 [Frankiales bacterium]|nr:hypothetical protein [Frankiales bacterium]
MMKTQSFWFRWRRPIAGLGGSGLLVVAFVGYSSTRSQHATTDAYLARGGTFAGLFDSGATTPEQALAELGTGGQHAQGGGPAAAKATGQRTLLGAPLVIGTTPPSPGVPDLLAPLAPAPDLLRTRPPAGGQAAGPAPQDPALPAGAPGTVADPLTPGPDLTTVPPVTDPPTSAPPVTDPPVTDPPVTDPPVTDPPVTDPPVTDPPVTDPVPDPSVTEPPVTDPVPDPSVTDPPVTDPVPDPSVIVPSSAPFVPPGQDPLGPPGHRR